jgi:hypothetical protein
MNKLIALGTLVLGFGTGAWYGYAAAPIGPTPPAAAAIPALVSRGAGLSAGRAYVDLSTLRALVREEMTAALVAGARSGSVAQSEALVAKAGDGQEPVSAETVAQRREAQEQIDTMIAQGVWGNEQRSNFQLGMAVMDSQQREHVLQQLTTAINSGILQVSTDGPPL